MEQLLTGEIGVFVITLLIFLQKEVDRNVRIYFLLLGISSLVMSYVTLLSLIGYIGDIVWYKVFQTLVASSLITLAISRITGVSRLNYLLLLIVNSALFILISTDWLAMIAIMAYYVAALAFFVLFIQRSKTKNAGFIGLLSTSSGIFLLFTEGLLFSHPLWILPDAFLILSLLYFVRFGVKIENIPIKIKMDVLEYRSREFWRPLGYIITYLILLNVSIIITGIGLHEIGHFIVGNIFGCSGELNLFESFVPGDHILVDCINNPLIFVLSGFLIILPFGIVFFLLRGFPERNFGFIVFGLAILLTTPDIHNIVDNLVSIIPFLIGITLVIMGEIFFINENIRSSSVLND